MFAIAPGFRFLNRSFPLRHHLVSFSILFSSASDSKNRDATKRARNPDEKVYPSGPVDFEKVDRIGFVDLCCLVVGPRKSMQSGQQTAAGADPQHISVLHDTSLPVARYRILA